MLTKHPHNCRDSNIIFRTYISTANNFKHFPFPLPLGSDQIILHSNAVGTATRTKG